MASFIPPKGPRRLLYLAVVARSLGFALWTTLSVLYYVRVVGLPIDQVAAGLTIAGLVGLAAGPLVGRLADRRGIREVMLVVFGIQAAGPLLALAVGDFLTFVLIATVVSGSLAVSQGLIGGMIGYLGGDEATSFRAQLQTVAAVTGCVGLAVPAIALQLDTPAAYRASMVLCAVLLAVGTLAIARIPHMPPVPTPQGLPGRGVLRDLPYVAVCALCGLLYTTVAVTEVLLPLWIVERTGAPRWTVAAALVLSSIVIAVLTVPLTSRVTTLTQGGRALARGGVTALAAFALIGLAAGMSAVVAVCLLLLGVALLAVAEVWVMAGEFALAYGLAPKHAQAEYQGLLSVAQGFGVAVTPAAAVPLVVEGGGLSGWLVIGVVFTVTGGLAPAAASWASRTASLVNAGNHG